MGRRSYLLRVQPGFPKTTPSYPPPGVDVRQTADYHGPRATLDLGWQKWTKIQNNATSQRVNKPRPRLSH